MPNMPFFTLQPIAPASPNGSAPSGSLQKSPLTQAVSDVSNVDNQPRGDDSGPSFMDTLNAQLDQPVLPLPEQGGQEFAALLTQSPGALQQTLQDKQAVDEATIVDGAWLQPMTKALDKQSNQASLGLQDIQRQRAVSVALNPQGAKQSQGSTVALETLKAANQDGSQNPIQQQTEQIGKLAAQVTPSNLAAAQQSAAHANNPANQAPNGVPAFSQKIQDNQNFLNKNANNDTATQWLDGEQKPLIDVQTLHEKPLTLTTPATLQSESMVASVQTAAAPVSQDTPELALTTGTGFSKEINIAETSMTKTPGELNSLNQAPSAQAKLDVPPSHPQWSEQIAKRIGIMSSEKLQTVHIQLDPPELGSLEVKIKIQNDQMQVAFSSNHSQVRDALEAQSPRLKEMLEQQGINLADVNVSDQSQQQAGTGTNDAQSDQDGPLSAMSDDTDNQEQVSTVIESDSLVDYFA